MEKYKYNTLHIEDLGGLFEDVQMNSVFSDNKTFVDCTPKYALSEIILKYEQQKIQSNFDLKVFVLENFDLPKNFSTGFESNTDNPPALHINSLWDILTRKADEKAAISTLIELPHPYVVPGGRFSEIYYWDSYFTMLGLSVSNRWDLIENMLDNFTFLINTLGYIPNGNRSYFVGRSQPPFFALMVDLLYQQKGDEVLYKYLPSVEKEYNFWMRGAEDLSNNEAFCRVVLMPDGSLMNRYYDEKVSPRPESYREDVELAHKSDSKDTAQLWRNLRAACESGWDFSSRWFKDPDVFASIHTTDIIPVDLNCILLFSEKLLHKGFEISGQMAKADNFSKKIAQRKAAIQHYCWNEQQGYFFDFDFIENQQKPNFTLAGVFPLFFEVATPSQAAEVAQHIENKFLQSGGLITTLQFTDQQWDAPNGWAPLQWIAYKGLQIYGFTVLADKIKTNWLDLNEKVYNATGKFTEKYDVFQANISTKGGEYPNQDGFGWTNGVFLKMKSCK